MQKSKIGAKDLEKIKELAKIVRIAALVQLEKKNLGPIYSCTGIGKRLGGACGEASQVLLDLIRKNLGKNYAEFENGGFDETSHCWLRLRNGMILDITATQFNPNLPGVYIAKSKAQQDKYEIEGTGECCEPARNGGGYSEWRKDVKRTIRQIMVKNGATRN